MLANSASRRHVFRSGWTGWFSSKLDRVAKAHLSSTITLLFTPPDVAADATQQATHRLFPMCVFAIGGDEEDDGSSSEHGEVVVWKSAPPPRLAAALSINGDAAGVVPAGLRPVHGVKHGDADFFVVCGSASMAAGLADTLGATRRRFVEAHGRAPTFCVPAVCVSGGVGNAGPNLQNPVLASLPTLASGCGRAVLVLDDALLAEPFGVLQLFSALAIHFKPGAVEVAVPAGGRYAATPPPPHAYRHHRHQHTLSVKRGSRARSCSLSATLPCSIVGMRRLRADSVNAP